MTRRNQAAGFTAVELLITLFVAAAFLIAGYQLFNLIIKDGGNTRAESSAGNIAYDYLRRYTDSATNPCTASSPLTGQTVAIDGVSNATVSITISCAQSDAPTLSKIEATVSYGVGAEAKTVKYATYVDRSRGATPNVDVTDGLIGWWQLNQNANSSAGPYNGTPVAIAPTTGQNGQGASAFLFDGSSSYVKVSSPSLPEPTTALTVTAWFKPDVIYTTGDRVITATTEAGGWSLYMANSCNTGMLRFQAYVGGAYVGACAAAGSIVANQWYFAAGVYDGSSVKLYIKNAAAISTAASGTMTYPTDTTVPLCIGSEPGPSDVCSTNYFDGSIDDVRYYNRALSASEILQLYNGGAK